MARKEAEGNARVLALDNTAASPLSPTSPMPRREAEENALVLALDDADASPLTPTAPATTGGKYRPFG
ncbi:hypothetical protein E2562_013608 [Oryza meyeriana var. granulata]|uniref:Uncharacterized protein n=1 Tax=Oryza meyeriana var. granulata TaxID=110450 RepID=A0A6G1C5T1_9ORYZ|nr:hypothetical protein E2562_013608 [Oryza meyeriana var. granulata]